MDRIGYELGIFLTVLARVFLLAPLRWSWAVLCVTRREMLDTYRDALRITKD